MARTDHGYTTRRAMSKAGGKLVTASSTQRKSSDAHLRHWRNARRYHRNANGDEGNPYLDAPLPAV